MKIHQRADTDLRLQMLFYPGCAGRPEAPSHSRYHEGLVLDVRNNPGGRIHDELFALWRQHHVLMVERQIGSKTGTGGSTGASYLRTTLEKRFFPELWDLRSYL